MSYLVNSPLYDTEPCENCGTHVVALSVKGVEGINERPRIYEPGPGDDPFTTRLVQHTPERCRAFKLPGPAGAAHTEGVDR